MTAPASPSGRWRRVQELFEAAADLPAAEQAALLDRACAGDDGLRAEVAALLRSDAAAGTFIESAIRRGSDLLLAAPPDPLAVIGRAGKVEILERIGEGGFGVVYKGRDPVLQRYVAVKTCSSRDEKLRRRFVREGQIAAGLQHPNITTVHDLGIEQGVPYLVQEFLEGEDLHHKIARREPLTPLQRLDILVQVARGLDHAHRQGVLHRDIKPANVRVLPGGAVKIMDFGIAKLLHEVSEVTTQGLTLGTVGYLAPEQLRGEAVDRRTDIFSYGVLAYELLTHERPFKGSTFSEVSYRLLNEEPRELRDLAPAWSPAIAGLVARCLAKDPEQRCAGCGEILAVLEPEIEALRSGAFAVPVTAGSGAAAEPGAAGGRPAGGWRARAARRLGIPASRRPGGPASPSPAATRTPAGVARMAVGLGLAVALGLGGRTLWLHRQGPVPAGAVHRQPAAPAGGGSAALPGAASSASSAPPADDAGLAAVDPAPAGAAARSGAAARAAAGEVAGGGAAVPPRGGQVQGGGIGTGGASRPAATPAPDHAASGAAPTDAAAQGGGNGRPLRPAGAAPPRTDPAKPPPLTPVAPATPVAPKPRGAPAGAASAAARPGSAAGLSPLERRGDPLPHAAGAEGLQGGERQMSAAAPPASGQGLPPPGVPAPSGAPPAVAGGGGGAPHRPPDAGESGDPEGAAGAAAEPPAVSRAMVRGDLIPPGAAGVVAPRLLSRPEPVYPDRARRRRAEADVMLLVLVDETGHVIRAIVKRTDDTKLGFNDAARKAALRATFAPATRDGIPGKMWTELPFSFRFND